MSIPMRRRLAPAQAGRVAQWGMMLALAGIGGAAFAQDPTQATKLAVNHFDPAAPTVAVEDILEYRESMGSQAEARRQGSLRDSRACMEAPVAGAAPATPAMPPTAAPRDDLKNKSLMELALLYKQSPDPAVAAAIQWKALNDPAARPGLPAAAGGMPPSMDQRLLGMLAQQGRAMQPEVQKCLEAADRQGQADPQLLGDFYAQGFDQARELIRGGRADYVVVDFFSSTYKLGERGERGELPPALKYPATGRLARYNLVTRKGPHGDAAVPLPTAAQRSRRADGEHWPELPEYQPPPGPARPTSQQRTREPR